MCSRLFGIAMTIGIAILAVVLPVDAAWADKRVALVIGNSNYASVPKLPNPSRDAISVGQMLRDAGFDSVDVIVNISNIEFKRAIRKFELDADQADIAVIFYAGHGLEISGVNYLIPVDAKLASDRDADDEAILLDRVVSAADGASKLRVIILDACRDNPFTSIMRRDRKSRVISSGLGKAEPTSTDTLIAYAARAGSMAEDGDGQHSPFTAAILKTLTVPGLDIRLAFGRVRDEVMRTTGSRQEPFVYGSLGGGNIALVPAPKVQDVPLADIKADYELVAKIGTRRAWEVFLGTHKAGFYSDLAREQIAMLTDKQDPNANVITRSKNSAGNGTNATGGKPSDGDDKFVVAAVPPPAAASRDSPSTEALDWNRIKDSNDPADFARYIQKYPNAPLALQAKKRLDILQQAQREREAAQKAAEATRQDAERKKAEAEAAKKREDEERQAKALEAEQRAKAAEAERKAAEERKKAEQAERERAAAEAAAQRAAREKEARAADEARKKAERASKEAACKVEQDKVNQIVAKGSEGSGIDDLQSFARTITCERLVAQVAATLDKFRAEQAQREREAAQKAAEAARQEAERKKAEAAAGQKREDEERRAREADAAERAKAAAAELAVAKKREEDERRAKADQAAKDVKAAEGKRKAEQAVQEKAAAEAAVQHAAAERQAKEDERRTREAEAVQKVKVLEAEKLAAEEKRKAEQAAKETACKSEQVKLAEIVAKGSQGSGTDDLNAFAKSVTCDQLGAQIVTAIDKFKVETAQRAATMPNSPQLITAAQTQLVRLGCALPGKPDGVLNDQTRAALAKFMTVKERATDDLTVTQAVVADLTNQTERVCPLVCKSNEVANGDKCVAPARPAAPVASRGRDDDDDGTPARKKKSVEKQRAEKEPRRSAPAPEPRVKQQATARPAGGGGGGAMIGVGF